MQNINEFLINLNESDFYENVNLHIHTNISDGILSPKEVIDEASRLGLKAISITDHNSINAYKSISLNHQDNLKIIPGVEFDCWYKSNLLHILGYGFDLNNEKISKICAKNSIDTRLDFVRFFNRRNAKNVIKIIKEANGIAVLAHPACCWNVNLKKMIKELVAMGLDGIEVYYPYVGHRSVIKFYSISRIKKLADEFGLLVTGGADSHGRNLRAR